MPPALCSPALSCAALALTMSAFSRAAEPAPDPAREYSQWKEALGSNGATPASELTPRPGFAVDLLRSAQPGEGSWVAMTFDARGRIIVAREDRGLLRLTLGNSISGEVPVRVETINTNLLECRGLLFAYDSLYVNANNSHALYRLRDAHGRDQFEEITLLKETPGGVGHGRNQLALGPDGMIYSIHGDDVQLPAGGATGNSPFANYAEDRLLGCDWDKHLFNSYVKVPCGHLVRTDRDGTTWELVAGGLRNPFGIAFNSQGDMFSFDADMEWDTGLPWYHPTRILHLVPGGDYGWRRGTGVLPTWSPDTLPSVVDIGLASPTAIMFGTKSHFPEPYRSALFALDWAYGRILAIQLTSTHSTYSGKFEVFLKGRPLNVTGLDFGPDGAMYFVTGGRRTQSGLYRVRTLRSESTASVARATTEQIGWDQGDRLMLEHLRSSGASNALPAIWSGLKDDRWTQYAARVALESVPLSLWAERALAEPVLGDHAEEAMRSHAAALLALARVGDDGLQARVRERLLSLISRPLESANSELMVLRALAVSYCRHGSPSPAEKARAGELLEMIYPSGDTRVNQQLCELLVFLESPRVVEKTIPLLRAAASQEEKIQYLFLLRLVKNGWTHAARQTYFEILARGRSEFQGANMLLTYLNYIASDAETTLSGSERRELADPLRKIHTPATLNTAPPAPRPFVRDWKLEDFADLGPRGRGSQDPARGQALFAEAGCLQCHRFGREGGLVGPDLTAVGSRFDRRALLESILEPSNVIAETYRTVSIRLKSGAIVDGRIVTEDGNALSVAMNPTDPDQRRRINKAEIEAQRISDISPMPAGLLNGFSREEILELIAFLESGPPDSRP